MFFNPIYSNHNGWRWGTIHIVFPWKVGQIRIFYQYNDTGHYHWSHLDNTDEIAYVYASTAGKYIIFVTLVLNCKFHKIKPKDFHEEISFQQSNPGMFSCI